MGETGMATKRETTQKKSPRFSIHWSIRTDLSLTPPVIMVCATLLTLLFWEEPDIIDAIIELIMSSMIGL